MKSRFGVPAVLTLLCQTALCHYRFTSLIVDSEVTAEYEYVRKNTNMNSPVTDLSSTDIRCNTGGLESGATTKTHTVAAGSTVRKGIAVIFSPRLTII